MRLSTFILLQLVMMVAVACAAPAPQSDVETQLQSTPLIASVEPTPSVRADSIPEPTLTPTIAPLAILPRPGGHSKPAWSKLEFPPGCSFRAISPDWQWVLLVNCPSTVETHSGDRLLRIDESGNLVSSQAVSGTFGVSSPKNMVIGFTSDSAHLIVYQDGSLKLVDPATLAMSPFTAESRGASGVSELGNERWSLDGKRYFGRVCRIGCDGRLSVVGLDGQEESAIEIGRLGTLDNWCGGGDDVVYIQRYERYGLRAALFDNTTHQSQALLESEIPNILTGVSCSPTGKQIVVRQYDADAKETTLWLIDPLTRSKDGLRYKLSGPIDMNDGWRDLIWSPDGTKLAVRGEASDTYGGYIISNVLTGEILFPGHKDSSPFPLGWSKDGRSLLVLDYREQDNTIYLVESLNWIPIGQ